MWGTQERRHQVIERFNFYDIYGYLLPGCTVVGLLWLPFLFWAGRLPLETVTAGIIALGAAYVTGHILQTVVAGAMQTEIRDSANYLRLPSDMLLDPANASFSKSLRHVLQERVREQFQLELNVTDNGTGQDEISRSRKDAFLLCRRFLLKQDSAPYTQQFQGMYALMRGLCGAFCLGGSYLVGWTISRVAFPWDRIVLRTAAVVTLLCVLSLAWWSLAEGDRSKKSKADRCLALAILVLGLVSGLMLGRSHEGVALWKCAGAAAAALFAAARCYSAYRYFELRFAETVWRDFAGFCKPEPRTPEPA
jgi:hypothetical protein